MVSLLRAQAQVDSNRGSMIAKNILRVNDSFLTTIFSMLLTCGLTQWCPDVASPPDTLYNMAHELIFVESYKAVAGSFAYRHMSPTPAGTDNHAFITDVYHSFAFDYMRGKARVEKQEPGKLSQSQEESNQSRRRKRVCGSLPKPPFAYSNNCSDSWATSVSSTLLPINSLSVLSHWLASRDVIPTMILVQMRMAGLSTSSTAKISAARQQHHSSTISRTDVSTLPVE